MAGLTFGQIASGLRDEVLSPMYRDVQQGNKVMQQRFPLAYQAVGLHPAIGIPQAGLNYADAMERGDRNGAIIASLSAIPIVEKAHRIGPTIAATPRQLYDSALNGGYHGLRGWYNNIGRRFAAGEQAAESGEAGWNEANNWMGR